MLYISASSIKDWLVCSKRYVYRTQYPKEDAEKTPDLLVGTAVHEVIEKHWKDKYDNNVARVRNLLDDVGINSDNKFHVTKAERCVKNFHATYAELLTESDIVEKSFKIELKPGAYLVGKIDRVIQAFGGIIVDWKTNTKPPKASELEKDVQFLIYRYAYQHMFKEEPAKVWYASLYTNDRILVQYNSVYNACLFEDVIPKMLKDISSNSYTKQGMFTGACEKCQYKKICIGE